MESLITAYAGGWLAIAAYVGWLVRQNARLARRLDELEAVAGEQRGESEIRSTAA